FHVTGVQTCALPISRAYSSASAMAMNDERAEAAFAWGERAFQLIDETGDRETYVYQLNNTATMGLLLGRPESGVELLRSIALAEIGRASCRERVQRW